MAGNIIELPHASGSFIGSFDIWRLPDGSICGRLTDMPARVIEHDLRGDVPAKMDQIAELFEQAAQSMRTQAENLR